ncbi:unnamed protein product [Pleuronectes platessa]|uniref:Uncharacterized protein n=1 Tax=Pleuronectes platessa TaxID=8262 RepID=A0A9N7U9N9_PLEPL|nr:unnamed protein product [Pleuronectes platessa]
MHGKAPKTLQSVASEENIWSPSKCPGGVATRSSTRWIRQMRRGEREGETPSPHDYRNPSPDKFLFALATTRLQEALWRLWFTCSATQPKCLTWILLHSVMERLEFSEPEEHNCFTGLPTPLQSAASLVEGRDKKTLGKEMMKQGTNPEDHVIDGFRHLLRCESVVSDTLPRLFHFHVGRSAGCRIKETRTDSRLTLPFRAKEMYQAIDKAELSQSHTLSGNMSLQRKHLNWSPIPPPPAVRHAIKYYVRAHCSSSSHNASGGFEVNTGIHQCRSLLRICVISARATYTDRQQSQLCGCGTSDQTDTAVM